MNLPHRDAQYALKPPQDPVASATHETDRGAFKADVRAQWDRSAQGWNDHTTQIRAWLGPATEAMIAMAGVGPRSRVLDVAAGAGDQTLEVAQRVGPDGFVLATDLSPAILALAQDNARRAGHTHVKTQVADGEDLQVPPQSFDAAVCRLGLMFFPDPLQGLRGMHRALKAGGGVCTMVFSSPARNPCITILMSTALKHAGLPARDPFQPGGLLSLGKVDLVEQLFRQAGFSEVATTKIDAPFRLPSAAHYLDFVRTSASPIQQILAPLGEAAASAAWAEMEERLAIYTTAMGWEGPNELLLSAGRA